ncbi:MAG: PTS sugar transporter subunit IIB [Gemmatimonadetes bacterium]|nr:PTS sugar transporter subunit IIB [Gemmatimonadota bacterium]
MSIVLYRVDERLVHGQVVLGWGSQLLPHRYLVVDDDLAASEWEQDLYRLGTADAELVFATVDAARLVLPEWRADAARSILLTRDIASMLRLARGGLLRGEKVNLGGIHHGPGRLQVLTYLHLTEDDVSGLRALEEEGVEVSARDLPDAHKVPLRTLLP